MFGIRVRQKERQKHPDIFDSLFVTEREGAKDDYHPPPTFPAN